MWSIEGHTAEPVRQVFGRADQVELVESFEDDFAAAPGRARVPADKGVVPIPTPYGLTDRKRRTDGVDGVGGSLTDVVSPPRIGSPASRPRQYRTAHDETQDFHPGACRVRLVQHPTRNSRRDARPRLPSSHYRRREVQLVAGELDGRADLGEQENIAIHVDQGIGMRARPSGIKVPRPDAHAVPVADHPLDGRPVSVDIARFERRRAPRRSECMCGDEIRNGPYRRSGFAPSGCAAVARRPGWRCGPLSCCLKAGIVLRMTDAEVALERILRMGDREAWSTAALVYALTSRGSPEQQDTAAALLGELGLNVDTDLGRVDREGAAAQAAAPILQVASLLRGEGQVWESQPDEALVAQGKASAQGVGMFAQFGLPMMPGLAELLAEPGARMLDVGTGVAALAVAWAQHFPLLTVVGIDVLPRALALAAATIANSDVADRVVVREQDVAQFNEPTTYSIGWLPAPFLPPAALHQGVVNVARALLPGGWLIIGHGKFGEIH
ncbi:MAG: SAM-dependent methyltransferase [Jatrophihabitans sp.]